MFYYIGFGLIEVIFEISKFVTEFIIPSRSTETVSIDSMLKTGAHEVMKCRNGNTGTRWRKRARTRQSNESVATLENV